MIIQKIHNIIEKTVSESREKAFREEMGRINIKAVTLVIVFGSLLYFFWIPMDRLGEFLPARASVALVSMALVLITAAFRELRRFNNYAGMLSALIMLESAVWMGMRLEQGSDAYFSGIVAITFFIATIPIWRPQEVVAALLAGTSLAGGIVWQADNTFPSGGVINYAVSFLLAIVSCIAISITRYYAFRRSFEDNQLIADMKTREARLKELGHVALYLGDRLGSPLTVLQFVAEEIRDGMEDNSSKEEINALLVQLNNAVNSIVQETKVLQGFKNYASNDALKTALGSDI